MEERKLPRRNKEIAIAETIVEEFLKGPSGAQVSSVPGNTRLLGIYKDTERVFYIELSEEFRRNFQGDALTEYFVLKGLYESLISNIPDLQDVKVLIEGREAETLGGHLYLSYPLKDMISYENE
jgi:spore germination protein GerM